MDTSFQIEIEQEEDGRWIAEVVEVPGAMAYGSTLHEATTKVQALTLRVLAERLEQGETEPDLLEEHSESFESGLGDTLEWERLDNRRASRVSIRRPGSIDDDEGH